MKKTDIIIGTKLRYVDPSVVAAVDIEYEVIEKLTDTSWKVTYEKEDEMELFKKFPYLKHKIIQWKRGKLFLATKELTNIMLTPQQRGELREDIN